MRIERKRAIYFIIFIILLGMAWAFYYRIGLSGFSKSSAITIFSSVIEGMSALLSVSIAVFIFRIQSLENRNQQLEESTLNFIFQITRSAYPKWTRVVEEDIRSKALTNRYYEFRVAGLDLNQSSYTKKVKEYSDDKDRQQERLEEPVKLHNKTEEMIKRIKKDVFSSVIFLVLPVLFSFYLLIVSDALDLLGVFFAVSITVLMAVMGIASLIMTVLESTVVND